jgi:hypothetical protein
VAKEKRVPGSSPGGMIEAVLGFPDEPQVKVQPCPECGGEVKIGLVGTLKLGEAPRIGSRTALHRLRDQSRPDALRYR